MKGSVQTYEKGKVSVIVPCYQHGHFLSQAVESILKQTYQSIEIIIINDGSTDDTHYIASYYLRKNPERIKYIYQENQGQARARKKASLIATGEFWLTLDADDLLERKMLKKCTEVLITNPEVAVVFSNVWMVASDSQRIIGRLNQTAPSWPDILTHNPLGGIAGILLRAEAVQKVGGLGFDGESGCEDWDLWIRMVKAGMKFAHIPHCLARYRQTTLSYSRQAFNFLLGTLEVLEHLNTENQKDHQSSLIYPCINFQFYTLQRNRAVFFAYGAAAAINESEESLVKILSYFLPSVIDISLFAQSFIQGFSHQTMNKKIFGLGEIVHSNVFQVLEDYLKAQLLYDVSQELINQIQIQIIARKQGYDKWYRTLKKKLDLLFY